MTTWRYIRDTCVATHGRAPMSHFSTGQCSHTHSKRSTGLPPQHFPPSILKFVTDRTYLGSFRTESSTAYEFGRIKSKFTATVERNVARHHTGLVCLTVSHHAFMLEVCGPTKY
ncbi:hypothetical protein TNCV_4953251 [Trichonephila clavipes]|nr:hypothetical protein TNCV_4953251 [Trichonephila clavipes]